MSYTPGLTAFKLAFQLSPIILTGGVMASFPGRMLPLIAITESLNFPLGLLSGGNVNLERFFANFQPLSGSSLLTQDIGRYPFANSTVAANAVIEQPTMVSVLMLTPAQNPLGMFEKLAVISALRATLRAHNNSGGTYIVATPSYIYTDCVFRDMRDASVGLTKQPQNAWQLDFEKPLLTLDDAQSAQNGLISQITSGAALTPDSFSGLGAPSSVTNSLAGVGINPSQLTSVAGNTLGSNPVVQAAFNAPTGTVVSAGPTGIGP